MPKCLIYVMCVCTYIHESVSKCGLCLEYVCCNFYSNWLKQCLCTSYTIKPHHSDSFQEMFRENYLILLWCGGHFLVLSAIIRVRYNATVVPTCHYYTLAERNSCSSGNMPLYPATFICLTKLQLKHMPAETYVITRYSVVKLWYITWNVWFITITN